MKPRSERLERLDERIFDDTLEKENPLPEIDPYMTQKERDDQREMSLAQAAAALNKEIDAYHKTPAGKMGNPTATRGASSYWVGGGDTKGYENTMTIRVYSSCRKFVMGGSFLGCPIFLCH